MGRLSDILNGGAGNFDDTWNSTPAAGDFAPLPKGVYVCHCIGGDLERSLKGTPGYKLTFQVIEGEFSGRKLWYPRWLSADALPASKRDLAKLNMVSPADLERPLLRWWRCKVTAVIRRDDSGIERNEVRGFEVLGIDKPEADPFAPPGGGDAGPPQREAGDEPPPVIPPSVPF